MDVDNHVWAILGSGKQGCIFLFTGGHSTELLKIITQIPVDLQPTNYIMCQCDKMTAPPKSRCIRVPRPRKSDQNYITSLFTCLWSLVMCIWKLRKERVKFLLCNGPALCFIVALALRLVVIDHHIICRWERILSLCTLNAALVSKQSHGRQSSYGPCVIDSFHIGLLLQMYIRGGWTMWVQCSNKGTGCHGKHKCRSISHCVISCRVDG